jgi:hypothetical protein
MSITSESKDGRIHDHLNFAAAIPFTTMGSNLASLTAAIRVALNSNIN